MWLRGRWLLIGDLWSPLSDQQGAACETLQAQLDKFRGAFGGVEFFRLFL